MANGDNCRTGCFETNHETYAECLQSSNVHVNTGDANSSKTMTKKRWDAELNAYAGARKQGVQPAGTTMRAVAESLEASDKLGTAFDAGTMPAAKQITKHKAKVMKEAGII